jgi:hypothetical protein
MKVSRNQVTPRFSRTADDPRRRGSAATLSIVALRVSASPRFATAPGAGTERAFQSGLDRVRRMGGA